MHVNGHKSKSLVKNLNPFPSTLCFVSVVQRHIHKQRMTQNVRILTCAREVTGINTWRLES
jgi:hypothetical protein